MGYCETATSGHHCPIQQPQDHLHWTQPSSVCPTTLWALVQAAEGPSMSASLWMCLCVPSWLVYGVIPEDQRLMSHPVLWASVGLNQSSVQSRPGRELGSDLALESTMWAVALDFTELESSINRKQKNMDQHLCIQVLNILGFPGSSAGRESACNAGDPRLIPLSGRSTGEGIGYPLQYSQASLVAKLVKNLPAMQETWVWSLGWEEPLEKGKAPHSSILAWRVPWTV